MIWTVLGHGLKYFYALLQQFFSKLLIVFLHFPTDDPEVIRRQALENHCQVFGRVKIRDAWEYV